MKPRLGKISPPQKNGKKWRAKFCHGKLKILDEVTSQWDMQIAGKTMAAKILPCQKERSRMKLCLS